MMQPAEQPTIRVIDSHSKITAYSTTLSVLSTGVASRTDPDIATAIESLKSQIEAFGGTYDRSIFPNIQRAVEFLGQDDLPTRLQETWQKYLNLERIDARPVITTDVENGGITLCWGSEVSIALDSVADAQVISALFHNASLPIQRPVIDSAPQVSILFLDLDDTLIPKEALSNPNLRNEYLRGIIRHAETNSYELVVVTNKNGNEAARYGFIGRSSLPVVGVDNGAQIFVAKDANENYTPLLTSLEKQAIGEPVEVTIDGRIYKVYSMCPRINEKQAILNEQTFSCLGMLIINRALRQFENEHNLGSESLRYYPFTNPSEWIDDRGALIYGITQEQQLGLLKNNELTMQDVAKIGGTTELQTCLQLIMNYHGQTSVSEALAVLGKSHTFNGCIGGLPDEVDGAFARDKLVDLIRTNPNFDQNIFEVLPAGKPATISLQLRGFVGKQNLVNSRTTAVRDSGSAPLIVYCGDAGNDAEAIKMVGGGGVMAPVNSGVPDALYREVCNTAQLSPFSAPLAALWAAFKLQILNGKFTQA